MKRLRVSNFSCIKHADINIDRLTVIIGPQASGKSILCKLVYFFTDMILIQRECLRERESFDSYKEQIRTKFDEWFPCSAWGDGKFDISFEMGGFQIRLLRKGYAGSPLDGFRLTVSEQAEFTYKSALARINASYLKSQESEEGFHMFWSGDEIVRAHLRELMGGDTVLTQLFIPAGRSFFTSIGKAMAFFEQGRMLDPIILRFGRAYAGIKEEKNTPLRRLPDQGKSSMDSAARRMAKIFGGKLKVERDREYVIADDGRHVPLMALSSGQQELLPLLIVLPWVSARTKASRLLYIEEPEAHLFPEAQSQLVEVFSEIINRASLTSLILTTHSPYVLSKINNLLKAGLLYEELGEGYKPAIERIVSQSHWLRPDSISAYAIVDGVVENIMDKSGLIDADYLDSVSGSISKEFMGLLEVEATA